MFKVRVIPCLDVKDGRVVKGVNFVDLRDAGDPVECAIAYDAAGADELCFLDITATHENRGIIFDVDPQFANTEEWWSSIPEEIRPVKNQPFYHLLAENDSSYYVAYVSEQNLLPDDAPEPVNHPQVPEMFEIDDHGMYKIRTSTAH